MKKIGTLFLRDFADGSRLVRNEMDRKYEWIFEFGVPFEKFDGTCCKIQNSKLFRRYDRKLNKEAYSRKLLGEKGPWEVPGDFKVPPYGWIACQDEPDPITAHWPGWVEVDGSRGDDKWFQEAFDDYLEWFNVIDGTFELIGPKINSNPYRVLSHVLWGHSEIPLSDVILNFKEIKNYLKRNYCEGIVWHHSDDLELPTEQRRMCKIKRSDFGIPWPNEEELEEK